MSVPRIGPLRDKLIPKLGLWGMLFLFLLPTVFSLTVFSYFPKYDAFVHAFYRWQPPLVNEIVGLRNFFEAFSDPAFWNSFKLVGMLLLANLVKMIPGILVAVALHRLVSDRLRYIFQVLFVIPLIIPGMVWLLIWKSFYEPDFGLLNRFLNATGLMWVLQELDTAMPAWARLVDPLILNGVNPVFAGTGGMIFAGWFLYCLVKLRRTMISPQKTSLTLAVGSLGLWVASLGQGMGTIGWLGIIVLSVLWMVVLARVASSLWIIWPLLMAAGLLILSDTVIRLPVMVIASCLLVEGVAHFRRPYLDVVRNAGIITIVVGALFVLTGQIWVQPTGQFTEGTPAWLGSQSLVIPAILFWGFPWVGTVSVLIYLSGLQNIPEDVYEAAELDGLGPFGKFLYIEVPLIMTQIRINLIFMTIGTLGAYEMFLILLGPAGGPGGKGMVPGLYMFRTAFEDGRFGYACALGMILFIILMLLTIIYQRFVRVDK